MAKNGNDVWFDSEEGIKKSCSSLVEFNKLIEMRRAVITDRHNKDRSGLLRDFLVHGDIVLSSDGSVSALREVAANYGDKREVLTIAATVPEVILFSEFLKLVEESIKPKLEWKHEFKLDIPKSYHVCQHCSQGWNVASLFDRVEIDSDIMDRNDLIQAIGLETLMTIDELAKGNLLTFNQLLGEKLKTRVRVYELDDEGCFKEATILKFAHKGCQIKAVTGINRKLFEKAIDDSGLMSTGSIRIPNEYGTTLIHGKWFLFDTDFGLIKIGWRKHVIEVDYSEIDPEYIADTDLTKGKGYEHVDDIEGLTKALSSFYNHLTE